MFGIVVYILPLPIFRKIFKGYSVTQKMKQQIFFLDWSCNSGFNDILIDKMHELNFSRWLQISNGKIIGFQELTLMEYLRVAMQRVLL